MTKTNWSAFNWLKRHFHSLRQQPLWSHTDLFCYTCWIWSSFTISFCLNQVIGCSAARNSGLANRLSIIGTHTCGTGGSGAKIQCMAVKKKLNNILLNRDKITICSSRCSQVIWTNTIQFTFLWLWLKCVLWLRVCRNCHIWSEMHVHKSWYRIIQETYTGIWRYIFFQNKKKIWGRSFTILPQKIYINEKYLWIHVPGTACIMLTQAIKSHISI